MEKTVVGWEQLDMPGADVRLLHGFLDEPGGYELFRVLRQGVAWRQDRIKIYGKEHPIPRLHQWFGEPGLTYSWSGILMVPEPWLDALQDVRRKASACAGQTFNTVLVNLYRSGNDAMAWHSDDEPELGQAPIIASLSLGAQRDFVLRHRFKVDVPDVTISLPHGSLLLMAGATQAEWKHSLPRRRCVNDERINLTFRKVVVRRNPRRRMSVR